MRATTVLVAFASQSGSTAQIAEAIAGELRAAGLVVECRPASEVHSLRPYGALVLGSGVFLRRRSSDGGGFLAHHAASVRERPVWLFCSGPIGRGRGSEGPSAGECPVMDVAHAVGARGAAAFGSLSMDRGAAAFDRPVDMDGVRAWARGIAAALLHPTLAAAS
jgi:menaquinone-dependent protoporphyrinogen oxidase